MLSLREDFLWVSYYLLMCILSTMINILKYMCFIVINGDVIANLFIFDI